MSKQETMKVDLNLPKAVYEFYVALAQFHKKNVNQLLVDAAIGDIKWVLDDSAKMSEDLVEAYGLEEFVQQEK